MNTLQIFMSRLSALVLNTLTSNLVCVPQSHIGCHALYAGVDVPHSKCAAAGVRKPATCSAFELCSPRIGSYMGHTCAKACSGGLVLPLLSCNASCIARLQICTGADVTCVCQVLKSRSHDVSCPLHCFLVWSPRASPEKRHPRPCNLTAAPQ